MPQEQRPLVVLGVPELVDLGEEVVEADEGPHVLAHQHELVHARLVLVHPRMRQLLAEPVCHGLQRGLQALLPAPRLPCHPHVGERVDLGPVVHTRGVELRPQVMDQVRVRHRLQLRAGVVRLEGGLDVVFGVHEVQHVGGVLAGRRAVQPGERLHGEHAGELLVHVQGAELRLVEAGLVLVGHDHHLVAVPVERLRQVAGHGRVHGPLGDLLEPEVVVGDLAGEGHQGAHVRVPHVLDVLVHLALVPDGGGAGVGDHHGLGLPVEQSGHVGAEVLHDDLDLLRDVRRVQLDPPHELLARLGLVHFGGRLPDGGPVAFRTELALLSGQGQLEGGVVVGEVLQHVEDELLLDGLLHGVPVEGGRDLLALLVVLAGGAAEHLQGLVLRGGGEGEEADVLRASGGGDLGGEDGLGVRLSPVVEVGLLVRGEHALELGCGGAGLGGVRLVRDHRVGAAGERRVTFEELKHGGEGLQRHHDDPVALQQRLLHQGGLAGGLSPEVLAVHGHHGAGGPLDLPDGLLKLVVQHGAVGDHDDRVEHPLLVRPVGGEQAVGGPGDGVGLAGARGVLDQVGLAGALLADGGEHRGDGLPLVEAREDQRGLPARAAVLVLHGLLLEEDELLEDLEPGVPLENPFPQVGRGGTAVRIERVAGVAVVALVERQEEGVLPGQLGGHPDLAVGDGEVDHGAGAEPEQRRGLRVALAVLLLRVADGLGGVGLQLDRRHGQAVDEQHQVHGLVGGRVEVHLTHHAEAHALVGGDGGRVQVRGRPRLGHAQGGGGADLEALAEHVEGAADAGVLRLVQHLDQAGGDLVPLRLLGGGRGIRLHDAPVVLRLVLGQPGVDVLGEDRVLAVVAVIVGRVEPAVLLQVLADVGLELALVVDGHVRSVLRGDLDLAGDGGSDQRRAALLGELDEPLRFGDEGIDLGGFAGHYLDDSSHVIWVLRP